MYVKRSSLLVLLFLIFVFCLTGCGKAQEIISEITKGEENTVPEEETEIRYTNTPGRSAYGGYIKCTAHRLLHVVEDKYTKTKMIRNYTPFSFSVDDQCVVEITLGNEEGLDGGVLGEYRISLAQVRDDSQVQRSDINISDLYDIPLYDWTTNHAPVSSDGRQGVIVLNLSEYIAGLGLTEIENARLLFEIVQDVKPRYILIEQIVFSANPNNVELNTLFTQINMIDANKNLLLSRDPVTNEFPIGFWSGSCVRSLYHAIIDTTK